MAADPLTSRTVDDLLLDNVGFDSDDNLFADKPPRNTERDDKTTLSPRKRKADEDIFGQNLDEEIKITKQRKKIPKLDAERLLSDPGIPKIRALLRSGQLKKKLRLKGKGHEFTDAARLLNYYQLWLDNLYPRAKFADAIQMAEKAGHTKKMQMYRKSWIDEGKPGHVRREEVEKAVDEQEARQVEASGQQQNPAVQTSVQHAEEDPASMFFGGADEEDVQGQDGPDDDELDALLGQDSVRPVTAKQVVHEESEGEDDLDALLAQESTKRTQHPKQDHFDDEDELDAMLDKHIGVGRDLQPATTTQARGSGEDDFYDDDLDELDAILDNQKPAPEPELPMPPISNTKSKTVSGGNMPGSEEVPELDSEVSSSPIPNVRTDELDQLMDEHDAAVYQKHVDTELVEEFMSSSPIPNRESQ